MATQINKCAGCQKAFQNRDILKCSSCKLTYDIECANVSYKRYTLMEPRQKSGWICPACRSNQPKTGNLNTPVRCAATIEDPASPEDAGFSNVTLRSNQSNQSSFNLPTSLTEEKFREILMTEISKASSSTVAELKIIGEKMSSFHESLNFSKQEI